MTGFLIVARRSEEDALNVQEYDDSEKAEFVADGLREWGYGVVDVVCVDDCVAQYAPEIESIIRRRLGEKGDDEVCDSLRSAIHQIEYRAITAAGESIKTLWKDGDGE